MDKSNLEETLKRIDKYINEQERNIKRGEALERLMVNPDFKAIILDGYIDTEAKKLFKILTDPSGASPYTPEEIHLKLGTISHFRGYVGTSDFAGTVKIDAEQAPSNILREQVERSRVTAEYAVNGE